MPFALVNMRNILAQAAKMVASGGRLVYSTCTFAPAENQQQVENFLQEHPEFSRQTVENIACFGEFSSYQMFPHIHKGEGHFLAVFRKESQSAKVKKKSYKNRPKRIKIGDVWENFARENLRKDFSGELRVLHDNLYLCNFGEDFDFAGLNALSAGLHLGKEIKGRFEPSHALALALVSSDVANCLDLSCDDALLRDYLAGESLRVDLPKGWCLLAVDGFGIGWGKVAGGRLNNYLPKGLRRR